MGTAMNVIESGWQSTQSIKKKRPKEKRKEIEFLLINGDTMHDGINLLKHISRNILSVQFADSQQKYATTKISQRM